VKAIFNSKPYCFPLASLLLGLYDYRLKHLAIRKEINTTTTPKFYFSYNDDFNNQDDDYGVSTTFNVADLTPYFGLEESESRTTLFQEGEDDEAISTKQDVNQAYDVEDVNTAREQVNIGPITRSRAKKVQQEVNALLCEIYFNINENYILHKSCTLLLLQFTKEDDNNTKGEDYREGPHSNPTSAAEQSERISHNF